MMMMMRWVSSSLSLLQSCRDYEDDDEEEVGLFFTGPESTGGW